MLARASVGRSFGIAKTITGSAHFEGSTLVFSASSLDNGVTPIFLYDQGLPPYTDPPVMDPKLANGASPAYWDGEAVRLPENYQWTFSLQRQVERFDGGGSQLPRSSIRAHLVAGFRTSTNV